MSTLIEVRTSSGVVGRCDAKCYETKEPGCTCICGGANHGAGLQQAQENTREMAQSWLETYARERNLKEWWGHVPAQSPQQLPFYFIARKETLCPAAPRN